MDFFENSLDVMSVASILLLLLLNTHRALSLSLESGNEQDMDADMLTVVSNCDTTTSALDAATRATLQHFRLCSTLSMIDEDLGFWVKPRSTTWFSKFLLQEYDDNRWVQMFRMTKRSVFSLTQLLAPSVKKKDTKYHLAVPVTVRIACSLFKLSHGASLLICSEMFVVGRSTVSIMLRQVVHAINVMLRGEITWPSGIAISSTAAAFQNLCGLLGVLGAIDGTHFAITRPRFGAADYYYFKSGAYSMNCQAVVDSSKRFLDLYIGMPGSVNDSRMLRRSSLFQQGQRNSLWDSNHSFHGFSPYLLGDGGYPILPWLMVPHRRQGHQSMADSLFNRKLCKGRAVVENAFALLKQSFRELHSKTDLHVTFVPDVVTCCAILHNLLLRQSDEDVERLLEVLRCEGDSDHAAEAAAVVHMDSDGEAVLPEVPEGSQKRRDLGIFLSMQRVFPM